MQISYEDNFLMKFFHLRQLHNSQAEFISFLAEVKNYHSLEEIDEKLKTIEKILRGKSLYKFTEKRDIHLRKAIFYLQLILRQQASFQFQNNQVYRDQKEALIQWDLINHAYQHVYKAYFDPCQAPMTQVPLEHALAIYLPLLAPLTLPLLIGLMRETKNYYSRRPLN